jgi:hypothetical protein
MFLQVWRTYPRLYGPPRASKQHGTSSFEKRRRYFIPSLFLSKVILPLTSMPFKITPPASSAVNRAISESLEHLKMYVNVTTVQTYTLQRSLRPLPRPRQRPRHRLPHACRHGYPVRRPAHPVPKNSPPQRPHKRSKQRAPQSSWSLPHTPRRWRAARRCRLVAHITGYTNPYPNPSNPEPKPEPGPRSNPRPGLEPEPDAGGSNICPSSTLTGQLAMLATLPDTRPNPNYHNLGAPPHRSASTARNAPLTLPRPAHGISSASLC